MNPPRLFIVIPCYNEETVLPITCDLFLEQLKKMTAAGKISENSRILFVNDGSRDNTWNIILGLSERDPHFIGISQSRNRGHQNAVLAGLMEAMDKCDVTISIDCDGQDDVGAMDEMVDCFLSGSDIVYGVRNNRDTDTIFKRFSAEMFYRVLNWMGADCVFNHADYRLISKRALLALSEFKEVNIFLRGMVPLVGFNSTSVYYKREERIAGKSHYPLSKMIALAVDGITSLSVKPIRIITKFGALVSVFGFLCIIWSIICYLTGNTVPGWASATCITCFMGGVQILSLGVIGEYVGKIYMESKARPRYIISEKTYDDDEI